MYPSVSTKTMFCCLLFYIGSTSCNKQIEKQPVSSQQSASLTNEKPNIILILADDIGYEVPTYTGGQSYTTPNIDALAQSGMQFTHCLTAPLCSPSRVMLLTGKYNFRNYIDWGRIDTSQYTIANLLKDAGYATCVAGKWQLDGGDAAAHKTGFDSYLLFLPFTPVTVAEENAENNYRYKNPHLYQHNAFLPDSVTNGKYADDMFTDFIKSFIDSTTAVNKPFFVYYPMSLCHLPFSPTPDDPEYATWVNGTKTNNTYFPSMVKYMDKKVGELVSFVQSKGITENTVIIFISDNGTPKGITSLFNGKLVDGGKGTPIEYGIHVPFIIKWPQHINPGTVNENLINLPDFMPTLASIAGTQMPLNGQIYDGVDFNSSFYNSTSVLRTWSFCHSQPYANSKLIRWAQTNTYKLYDSINKNKFVNIAVDTLEVNPILTKNLTTEQKQIKQQLQSVLNTMHN